MRPHGVGKPNAGPHLQSGRALRLLAVSADITHPLGEIRLGIPLRAAAQQYGWSLRLKSFYACVLSDWLWADIVILQRAMGSRQRRHMQWLRRRGIAVVYEIDDLLTEPAAHLRDAARLRHEYENVRALLRQANAISCSTPRLAQHLSALGPPVFLTPNYGPHDLALQARHEDRGPVTLLLAASDHQHTQTLAEALKQLLRSRGQVQVVAIGPVAQSLQEQGVAVRQLPLMGRDQFLQAIAALPNPVGAIPMDDSPFSRCKSAIKFFDYTAAGIPCVCSDVPPYADVVEPGKTGLLCADDPAAWLDALGRLCDSAALRRQLNEAALAQVKRSHGLPQTVAAWGALVEQLHEAAPAKPALPLLQRLADVLHLGLSAVAGQMRQLNRLRKLKRQAHCSG